MPPSIEDMREKRDELNKQILKEELDEAKIQLEFTDRLEKANESIMQKTKARDEYSKAIQETEANCMNILEEVSLASKEIQLKQETVEITKVTQLGCRREVGVSKITGKETDGGS